MVDFLEKFRKIEKKDPFGRIRVIKLEGGAEVAFDLKAPTTCKTCKMKIWWAKTKSGKLMPINLCGTAEWESHFASCPDAKKFRNEKK